ncbi:uncharacterized protein MYCFIDRAFT_180624 [Pseudocercospora fijiensis CIRAD86]|uniref:Uncharacterized protein n=1 Tax=Pseudocercospora fijiensis (strain CIRAD86) TaxID=383855 RepID=M2ZXJ9_PSEFD|nr:uncharacterized protein MYCFIDRAFT_180624 [Pseudocercospora fijiensis CIRAD86]EME76811.1 hypothetical protein MYCFIDRAFT_180624 [Pseudocercospora fijiensis CIRAD86]
MPRCYVSVIYEMPLLLEQPRKSLFLEAPKRPSKPAEGVEVLLLLPNRKELSVLLASRPELPFRLEDPRKSLSLAAPKRVPPS